ncbi:MAG TPA: penicillin acylase family protein [Gemmatimonadaceae bacterium]|nr:penicillin acylase family protein [Gemmatimonadaceae bacterium]
MSNRPVRAIVGVIVLAGTGWAGFRGVGPVPPLGLLLDPANGTWSAALHARLPRQAAARMPALGDSVDVRYDDRGVPHIFAASEADAYRALGYVVARDRLFQMDLMAHAAAGRLTEWVGPRALPLDRQVRALGLPRAAKQQLAAMDTTGMGWRMLQAFAQGVNAYVANLPPARWPVEYKLLGVKPSRWAPVNSLLLFGRMAWMLAYLPDEEARQAARAVVGKAAAEALFPLDAPIVEPIQPTGATGPQYRFVKLPPPGRPDTGARRLASLLRGIAPPGARAGQDPRHLASNNWAVAPARSATGHALLANDPHLGLTLPSIWYEAQLVVPGTLDVYGVTIPGAPGIVLGFNRDVAWGFTNTGADVVDFYRETVDDSTSPRRYRLDGAWKPLAIRVEAYRGARGQVLRTDTIRYTHRGPLMHRFGMWVSMRWTALEPSDDIRAFYDASHATSAAGFLDAMAGSFLVPAQNIVAADRAGTIAIRSTGHFPLRPRGTDGLQIFDGSTSASDWTGYWPVARYPQSVNPAQGYLASANQQPVDPRQPFAYLGDERAWDPWRALVINQLLRGHDSVTVDDMRQFQVNPLSVRARLFVPHFVQAAAAAAAAAGGRDSVSVRAAARLLAHWDDRYTRDNGASALFELAMRNLRDGVWDELADSTGRRAATPSDEIMLGLILQPGSPWWDDRRTPAVVETRDDVMRQALVAAYDSLQARYGRPGAAGWPWGAVATVDIPHLLGLTGFSRDGLVTDGGNGTLNPAPAPGGGSHGPSWRLVVDLGPTIRAWDTYPGGQSGNPASPRYADRIPQWLAGQLSPVLAPDSLAGLPAARVMASLTLRPGGN